MKSLYHNIGSNFVVLVRLFSPTSAKYY